MNRPSGNRPHQAVDRPPWSPAAERIAIAAFWTFIAALEMLRRTVNPFPPASSINVVAYMSVGIYAVWALLTPVIFELARRLPFERGTIARRLTALFGVGLGVSMLVTLVEFGLIRAFVDPSDLPPGPGRFFMEFSWTDVIFRLWFLDELVIYVAVLAVGFARNFFIRLRARELESAQFRAEAANLQAQLADARLSALQMQLNPHFLFNTLHSVSSMADENPEGVQRIVARLSALLRRTLEATERQEVTLEEELSFLRDYLEIQRVRFHDRLEVTEDVDDETLDALVPNLILQPVVENAVKFSANQGRNGAGRLCLKAERVGERLLLTVRDNGPGLSEDTEERVARQGGIGLSNTRARLDVLYGKEAKLELANAPHGGVVATIQIPYHTADELRSAADE